MAKFLQIKSQFGNLIIFATSDSRIRKSTKNFSPFQIPFLTKASMVGRRWKNFFNLALILVWRSAGLTVKSSTLPSLLLAATEIRACKSLHESTNFNWELRKWGSTIFKNAFRKFSYLSNKRRYFALRCPRKFSFFFGFQFWSRPTINLGLISILTNRETRKRERYSIFRRKLPHIYEKKKRNQVTIF